MRRWNRTVPVPNNNRAGLLEVRYDNEPIHCGNADVLMGDATMLLNLRTTSKQTTIIIQIIIVEVYSKTCTVTKSPISHS